MLDCDGSAGEAGASLYQIQDAHAIASGFVDEISLDDWRNVFFSRFISLRLFFSRPVTHTLSVVLENYQNFSCVYFRRFVSVYRRRNQPKIDKKANLDRLECSRSENRSGKPRVTR